jgi:micrococcal nuclease
MPRLYHLLPPLLSLFLVRVELTEFWPLTQTVRVLKILDADTIEVTRGKHPLRIRLAKIDAPEMGQPFWHGKGDAGASATKCAQQLIKPGQSMQLKIFKQDIYRRLLGDLDDVSFQLVRQGCAGLYPYAEFTSQTEKFRYLKAWQQARREGLGLWQQGGYLQPRLWRKKIKSRRPQKKAISKLSADRQ